ncbi:MAG TPA: pitrilysin family protein [Steroidobacteraceae bacterium]|jgi:zinc protease|nr:pitrilysin family protein [Steroidobacteraceae bacterium]
MSRTCWSHRLRHFLLALLLAAQWVVAAEPVCAATATKVITIEGVSEYRLNNGLKLLLYPDDSSTTTTVNITYKVGSRFESYGETGMAHLLEHLSFKGTPRNPNIPDEISSHGASANATTADDRTNYFETFPATQVNLEWALGLEADRMVHSFIAKKDLDSEMTVVRNEYERGENSPVNILRERVLETAYLWHNYGHPTIGARSDIENVPITDLQKFYRTYYQPDNAVLIVAGNFDESKTLAYIERVFGAIPRPTRVLPALYTVEPVQDGERDVTLRRTGGQRVLIESFHIPADAQADSAALGMLTDMLNERPAGRLYKDLIATKLAVQASANASSMHDPGYLMVTVILPKDGDLPVARAALDKLLAGLATEPFTEIELQRVKAQELNGYERLMNSSPQVAADLSENVAAGDWRLLFWDRDQMKKVTIADVQRVARSYLISSNLTVGTFIPEETPLRAVIPAAPSLTAMLQGYTGSKAVEPGERFDATPANIEARTRRATIGSLKTAFLERKSRGGRVSGVIRLHFGDLQSLQNLAEVGRLTGAMLMRGTQKHTRQQLQDELTRLKATLGLSGDADGAAASFETSGENLPALLDLAAEVLQQPAFPADQLDEIKRQRLAQIESSRSEPQSLASQAERRYLSPYAPGDFRYAATFDEQAAAVSKATVQELQQFQQHFYGASNGEAAFVGSFDPAVVTQALQRDFGSWKSPNAYVRAPAVYKATVAKSETIDTPDKANAVFLANSSLRLRDDDPAYPALQIGNAILGGGFLNSRLATRIRQHDGVSYTVGSDVGADPLDAVGSFSVYAICAPQNIGRVETDVHEELKRALQSGFTAKEVADAKSGILQSRIVGRSTDRALANALVNHLFLGRDFSWDARFEQRIGAATPQTIDAAMRRFIDPQALFTVKAGDFSKPVESKGTSADKPPASLAH